MPRLKHARTDESMINPRCRCGWKGEVLSIKGKSDAQLCLEAENLFDDHVLKEEGLGG